MVPVLVIEDTVRFGGQFFSRAATLVMVYDASVHGNVRTIGV